MSRVLTFVVAVAFIPIQALAVGPGPREYGSYNLTVSGAAFTGLSINVSKTFDAVNIGGWQTALVQVEYTWAAATHVTMTCIESPDNAKWYIVPELDDMGAGVLDHYQRTWRWVTGGASANIFFEVPMRFRYLRCTIGSVLGAAGDTVTASLTVAE